MAGSNEIRAGKAFVEIGAKFDGLNKGLNAASKRLKAWGSTVQGWGTKIAAAGAAIAGPLTAAAATFGSMASEMTRLAARTGASVEALSQLAYAASMSGVDVETLGKAMAKMQKIIGGAEMGTDAAAESLRKLGFSVAEITAMAPDAQFVAIADAISRITDPAMRAAMTLEIFGRGGAELLPLLTKGASGISALRAEADRLGLTMSTADAMAGKTFQKSLKNMWATAKMLTFQLGAAVAPAITRVTEAITASITKTIRWAKDNRDTVSVIFKVAKTVAIAGAAIAAMGTALIAGGTILGMLASAAAGFSSAIAAVGAILAATISPVGLLVIGLGAIAGAFAIAGTAAGVTLGGIGDQFKTLMAGTLSIGKSIGEFLAAGFSDAANAAAATAGWIAAEFRALVDAAGRAGQGVVAGLAAGFRYLVGTATGALATTVQGLKTFASTTAAAFWEMFTGLGDALLGVSGATNTLVRLVAGGLRATAAVAKTVWAGMAATAAIAWAAISTAAGAAWFYISIAAKVVLAAMTAAARMAASLVGRAFQTMVAIATPIWNTLSKLARFVFVDMVAAAGWAVKSIAARFPALVSLAGGAWKGITTVMGKLTAIAGVVGRSLVWIGQQFWGLATAATTAGKGIVDGITAGLGWAAAAAWKTITSIGSGFSSLVGWAAAAGKGVVATIVAYFNQAGTAASDAVQWIADRFWSLLGTAAETWKGISSALAAGDIVLAARVLWAMLKMEWQKGVNFLSETWATFKETMMAVATEAVYGVATALTNGWALLQAGWIETTSAMSAAWTIFTSGIMSGWRTAQNWISKKFVELMGLLDSSVDVQGAQDLLDKDFAEEQKNRDQATQADLAAIETKRKAKRDAIEQERKGAAGILDADRQKAHADRQKGYDDQARQGVAEVEAAKKEWQDSLDAAASAAKAADDKRKAGKGDMPNPDLEAIDPAQIKASVVGTFNPFGTGGLATGAVAQRTAKATEKIAANTAALLLETRQSRPQFV